MVDIGKLAMPKHLEFAMTQEGYSKMQEEIAVMEGLIRQAGEIADKYGFVLTVEIEDRK